VKHVAKRIGGHIADKMALNMYKISSKEKATHSELVGKSSRRHHRESDS
jgi:hypothetical protein